MNGNGDYIDAPLRPYVLTGGRAAPSRNSLGVDTLLVVAPGERSLPVEASRQVRALLRVCRKVLSVAEAAALVGLPVSTVLVLASDLIDSGHLNVRSRPRADGPSLDLLQEVLDGLLNLK